MRNLGMYALTALIAAGANAEEVIKRSEVKPVVSYNVHVFEDGKLIDDETYHDFGKEGKLNMYCRKTQLMLQPACTVIEGAPDGGVVLYAPHSPTRVPYDSDEGRRLQRKFEEVKSKESRKNKGIKA